MLEIVKDKIWEILAEKEVSLAMIYDGDGRILWHKGRPVVGSNIAEGDGFSKSYMQRAVQNGRGIHRENVVISSKDDVLSKSASRLVLKSILIQPLANGLYLYLDSGKKETFTECEREMFKLLGDVTAKMLLRLKERQSDSGGISGGSVAIEKVKKLILNFAIVEEPILLKGETGVGKNHVAREVHRYSGRKGNYVVVHTPSINEHLFESEIFGHKKGTFTDAKFDQKGLVAEADGGTIFFDEISEIPLSFQAKLLRFIETKKYRILGESFEREADVHIITATNRDLSKSIEEGSFREDLYFRLHVLEIEIPALRKRPEDIKAIVEEHQGLLRGKVTGDGFWEAILNYDWPGNVRELITMLKRVGIMSNEPVTGKEVQELLTMGLNRKISDNRDLEVQQVWHEIRTGKTYWEALWTPFIARDVDRKFVKQVLKKAYVLGSDNFKNVVEILNIPPEDYQKFMSLMYKYRLDPRSS